MPVWACVYPTMGRRSIVPPVVSVVGSPFLVVVQSVPGDLLVFGCLLFAVTFFDYFPFVAKKFWLIVFLPFASGHTVNTGFDDVSPSLYQIGGFLGRVICFNAVFCFCVRFNFGAIEGTDSEFGVCEC